MTFSATLTLSQNGRQGEVTSVIEYDGDIEAGSEAHMCMTHIEDLWNQVKLRMPEVADAEGLEPYSSTLTFSQNEVGGDVFTKLEMFPKLKLEDMHPVPASYEAICFLAQTWLQMAGIIDDEGNVIDPASLENDMDLQVTEGRSIH